MQKSSLPPFVQAFFVYFSVSVIRYLMFEESFSYSAVNEGATGSEKEALHNPEGCSSSFQRLVVTEEKKWVRIVSGSFSRIP